MQNNVADHIIQLGQQAKSVAMALSLATSAQKNLALKESVKALRAGKSALLAANEKDVESVRGIKPDAFIDRLKLTDERIESMAKALEDIIDLPDPVGRKLANFDRPNGLKIDECALPEIR